MTPQQPVRLTARELETLRSGLTALAGDVPWPAGADPRVVALDDLLGEALDLLHCRRRVDA